MPRRGCVCCMIPFPQDDLLCRWPGVWLHAGAACSMETAAQKVRNKDIIVFTLSCLHSDWPPRLSPYLLSMHVFDRSQEAFCLAAACSGRVNQRHLERGCLALRLSFFHVLLSPIFCHFLIIAFLISRFPITVAPRHQFISSHAEALHL